MTTFDLSGEWEGHYVQDRGRRGISMRVVQRGQSFVGAMRDADTLLASREKLHAQAADGSAKPELIGEAEVLSTLPEHSTIEGEVEGRIVEFTKSYRGHSRTDVWVPGRTKMQFEAPGHQVNYRGTLDATGNELTGYWTIAAPKGAKRLRDRFVLRRARHAAGGAPAGS
jgi:hypothetical protein